MIGQEDGRPLGAFLEALGSSLWDRPIRHSYFDGLNRKEWITIFSMSFHQTVEGHIADAILALPQSLLPPQDLLLKWIVRLQHIEENNRRMAEVVSQQGRLFQEFGIKAYLQKGHGVSMYYPKPDVRVSGDIDWFFPTRNDYDRANQLMKERGEGFHVQPAYSSGYSFEGVETEHHLKLIQLRNPFVLKYCRALVKELSRGNVTVEFGPSKVEIPSPLLNIVQVNAHILKHQVTYGIGLRQLCDSAILYHRFHDQIDGGELKHIYKKLGMLDWSHVLHQVLVDLLGIQPEKLPYEIEQKPGVEWMKEYILRTGNFGFYDPLNPDINNPGGRVNRRVRLMSNFKKLYPLAPVETICFPFVHLFSKIHH